MAAAAATVSRPAAEAEQVPIAPGSAPSSSSTASTSAAAATTTAATTTTAAATTAAAASAFPPDSPEAQAERLVGDLYHVRDHFFDTHPLEAAGKREGVVAAAMVACVAELDKLLGAHKGNAQLIFLKGKALNVAADFSKEAEECLAKAVKLDPNLTEAWNTLGECYWKNGDAESSMNCFTGALAQRKNKVSLRNLSILLRQPGKGGAPPTPAAIAESVEKAREAAAMDVGDGESWYILGNAYLSQYFATLASPRPLLQALRAYQQAERDAQQAANNPDLHYNRSQALKYLEDYDGALQGYRKAAALDPANPLPAQMVQAVEAYVGRVQDAIAQHGRVRPKRLAAMLQAVRAAQGEGETATLAALTVGPNPKAKLHVAVLSVLTSEEIPQAFLCADTSRVCFCLTVYNMQRDGVKVGDVLAIPAPMLGLVQVSTSKGSVSYPSIRVDNPANLVVNGSPLGTGKLVKLSLVATATAE